MEKEVKLDEVVLEKVSDTVAEYTPVVIPKVRVDANEITKQIKQNNQEIADWTNEMEAKQKEVDSFQAMIASATDENTKLTEQLRVLAEVGVVPSN